MKSGEHESRPVSGGGQQKAELAVVEATVASVVVPGSRGGHQAQFVLGRLVGFAQANPRLSELDSDGSGLVRAEADS